MQILCVSYSDKNNKNLQSEMLSPVIYNGAHNSATLSSSALVAMTVVGVPIQDSSPCWPMEHHPCKSQSE